jgi:AraC-like DNA-binding protein
MSFPSLHLRSYEASTGPECHEVIQWVFPLRGEMEFEVSGRGGRLSSGQGVFVASGERHDQFAREANTFLVIDCPPDALGALTHEALRRQPWLAMPNGLATQLGSMVKGGAPRAALSLVLAHFSPSAEHARLHAVCAHIEAKPAAPWTVQAMSELAGLSVSRFHTVFGAYFGVSPSAWLGACRLRHARHALETTPASLVDIALGHGYSEQSAFTRAFRREVGMAPGLWRRKRQ